MKLRMLILLLTSIGFLGCSSETQRHPVSESVPMQVRKSEMRKPARFLSQDECFPKGITSFDAILASQDHFDATCRGSFDVTLGRQILVKISNSYAQQEVDVKFDGAQGRCTLRSFIGATNLTKADYERGLTMNSGDSIELGVTMAGTGSGGRWSDARMYFVDSTVGLQNLILCEKKTASGFEPVGNHVDAEFLESILPIKIGGLKSASGGDSDAP